MPLDRLLANVSVYWFIRTASSSANLYFETTHARTLPELSAVPTGVAVFREDLAIRRYGEKLFNIVHWSDFDTGGTSPRWRRRNRSSTTFEVSSRLSVETEIVVDGPQDHEIRDEAAV